MARDAGTQRPRGDGSADLDQLDALVDRWLARVERDVAEADADSVAEPDEAAPGSPPLEAGDASERRATSGSSAEGAAGATETVEPAPDVPDSDRTPRGEGTPAGIRAALSAVRLEGRMAVFEDGTGSRVALDRRDGVLHHAGGIAVRGPLAPSADAFGRTLSPEAGRAFEFVAAWFGRPFDAVTGVSRPGGTLSWGFWTCTGKRVAHVLAAWKQHAPSRFDTLFGRYGFDVAPVTNGGGTATFELVVRDDRRILARGRSAAVLVASDPRRLAVLARAGREREVQLAQIEAALQFDVRHALDIAESTGDADQATARAVARARDLAALLLVVLRGGLDAARQLYRDAQSLDAQPVGSGRLGSWEASLRRAGRTRLARELRLVIASPELDD